MAELLYRLGRACARRSWTVLAGWLVVLLAAGGAYLAWGGTLTSAVTIPGTATAEVTDRLQTEFPEASGGSGTVLFHTTDGTALTAEQRTAISAAVTDAAAVDGVAAVIDPFTAQAQREQQAATLAENQQLAADGRAQAEDGQAQLDAGLAQAQAGLAQLDAARAAAEADGSIALQQSALDAQQATLDATLAELQAQQATLDASLAQLDAAAPALTAGQQLLDAASGIRTISQDGSAAVAHLSFTLPGPEVAPETKEALAAAVTAADIPGVEVDLSNELVMGMPALGGVSEVVGVAIAAVVLFIMLGTLIGAGLPLINALLGVGVGALGAMALSGTVDMMSVTPILGVMLGLAVGIDYSLFILNRHRRQLREGADLLESIGLANGTSGNAVVFAGSTVIIALLALNLTGIPFLGLMGTVAAACVLIAVLVAVTLTPALLRLVGTRIIPKRLRAQRLPRIAATVEPMSTPRAWLRIVLGIAALAIVALPAMSMRLGLPDGTSEDVDSTQYRSYSITAEKFGEGVTGPLVVVADIPTGLDETALTLQQAAIVSELMAQDDVVAVAPAGVSQDGALALFQVVPREGPNSVSTEQLVHALRDLRITDADGTETTLGIAGFASGNIDVSEKLASALPVYLAVVVGLSLLILILVFRSILVPVIATGGFVLSVLAAFGGVTAIYQWGWLGSLFGVHDPAPILSFLPVLMVGILFGLAMDYQLFLTSGMREAYVHGSPARRAVAEGYHAGRSVVTAAAIIMISVFSGFIFSHTAIIRPIGFGLAFGVLLDAFVVRLLIMPALMHVLGDAAWWLPRWLQRILPDVDVEGAKLERHHHAFAEDDETPDAVVTPAPSSSR